MYLKHVHLENFGRHDLLEKQYSDGFAITEELNGAGKTTIANAVAWVLTGKKLDGSADIANYKPRHDTTLKVIAEITIITGWLGDEPNKPESLILRKEFAEDWKTIRGTDESVCTGHAINYYINTVSMKAQEYEKELTRYFALPSYDWVASVTNPRHFAEVMTPAERLKKVVDAVGEPLPVEIYTSEPITARIESDIKAAAYNADTLRRSLASTITNLKKNLMDTLAIAKSKTIDIPIAENDYLDAVKLVADAPSKEAHILARKSGLNPRLADLQRDYTTSRSNDLTERSRINQGIAAEIVAKQKAVNAAHDTKRQAMVERDTCGLAVSAKQRMLDEKKTEKDAKLAVYTEVKKRVFIAPDVCETCGRPFDESHIEEARGRFNAQKAADLEKIITDGTELKLAIAALEKEIPAIEQKVIDAKNVIGTVEAEIRKTEGEISTLNKGVLYSYESDATTQLRAQIETEQAKSIDDGSINDEIETLHQATKTANAVIQSYLANVKTINEKTKLESEAKRMQGEIGVIESKQTALTIYEKTWRDLMERRARKVFPDLPIRFTKANMNGTFDRDCTFLNPKGVTYESTNTAEKYQIGVEIVENWRAFYGIETLPIIMDDFEHMDEDHQAFASKSQLLVFAVKRGTNEREARA